MTFFFNDTATTEIYTLSLHDALPISIIGVLAGIGIIYGALGCLAQTDMKRLIAFSSVAHMGYTMLGIDRKSTRLNSSHANISYAVFCLKKKTRPGLLQGLHFMSRQHE